MRWSAGTNRGERERSEEREELWMIKLRAGSDSEAKNELHENTEKDMCKRKYSICEMLVVHTLKYTLCSYNIGLCILKNFFLSLSLSLD